ncbi:hypothetical protein [Actinomycetospora sp. CA-084318]|uniref:hypothetical protein n=1 Tax=Actinomycetospora sp. CA-084318 TaxID=3239892 RepID=UPI003D954256
MSADDQPDREPTPGPADEPIAETPAEAADAAHRSGSRWEPGAQETTPVAAQAAQAAPAASSRTRPRWLRVVGAVVAALVLVGGGFLAGLAVGDHGPRDGSPGIGRQHDRDGGDRAGGRGGDRDGDRGGPGRPGAPAAPAQPGQPAAPAQPALAQPGPAQPGVVQPGSVQPGSAVTGA